MILAILRKPLNFNVIITGSDMSEASTLVPDEKEINENVPPLILGDENERPNTFGTETSRSTLHRYSTIF